MENVGTIPAERAIFRATYFPRQIIHELCVNGNNASKPICRIPFTLVEHFKFFSEKIGEKCPLFFTLFFTEKASEKLRSFAALFGLFQNSP
jgi:hypothetical protein